MSNFSRVQVTPAITGADAPVTPPADGKPVVPPVEKPAVPPVTPPVDTSERPKWLPEKFKTAEEFATAYAELEKKQSTTPPAETPAAPEIDPATGKPKETTPPAAPEGDAQFKPFFDEFAKDGKLSDASMEALAKKGFSKEVVEQFIEGGKARQAAYEADVMSVAGGAEGYKAAAEWAAKNMTAAEIKALNAALESGNVEQAKLAASGLHARHLAAVGSPPALVRGKGGETVVPFKSSDEVTRAMSDARYRTDENYRKSVEARLAISDVI